jgi:hypothetical protein
MALMAPMKKTVGTANACTASHLTVITGYLIGGPNLDLGMLDVKPPAPE